MAETGTPEATAIQETAAEAPAWQQEATSGSDESVFETPFWHSLEPEAEEKPLDSWTPEAPVNETPVSAEAPTWTPEPAASYETPETESLPESVTPSWQATEEAPSEAEPEPVTATPEQTLFGRVQVNISPVPDFDRLLNLDSALSRVSSVQTVTLADYAQEEVTFRIDLASPLDANDFAQQLGEAAGVSAQVIESNAGAVTLRLA
jgi:hypothetical protein